MSQIKYRIVKNLPFERQFNLKKDNIIIKEEDGKIPIIVTNDDKTFSQDVTNLLCYFDFNRTEYVQEIIDKKYEVGEQVYHKKYKVGRITKCHPNGTRPYTYRYDVIFDNASQSAGKGIPEADLIKPTWYWFLNSSGQIQKDFAERNENITKYRQYINNYFSNHEAIINKHDKLWKLINDSEIK